MVLRHGILLGTEVLGKAGDVGVGRVNVGGAAGVEGPHLDIGPRARAAQVADGEVGDASQATLLRMLSKGRLSEARTRRGDDPVGPEDSRCDKAQRIGCAYVRAGLFIFCCEYYRQASAPPSSSSR